MSQSKSVNIMAPAPQDFIKLDSKSGTFYSSPGAIDETVRRFFIALFGPDIAPDLAPDTVVGTMVEMFKGLIITNTVNAVNIANQDNIMVATGVFLDSIAQAKGLSRHPPRRASVNATVSGNPKVHIPRGTKAESRGGDVFISVDDATLDSKGQATILFISEEAKKISLGPGDLNTLLDRIDGVASITNKTAAIPGADQESDDAFRQRVNNSFFLYSSCTPKSLETYIRQTSPSTLDALVINNNTGGKMKVGDLEIPEGYFWVCVYGGTEDSIARAIYVKAGGCPMVGKNSYVYLDKTNNQKFKVFFDYAVEKYFDVVITVGNSINDVTSKVAKLFEELRWGYVVDNNLLKIGKSINNLMVAQFLTREIAGLDLLDVQIGRIYGDLDTITIAHYQNEARREIDELDKRDPFTSSDLEELKKVLAMTSLLSIVIFMRYGLKDADDKVTKTQLKEIEADTFTGKNYLAKEYVAEIFEGLAKKMDESGALFDFSQLVKALADIVKDKVDLTKHKLYVWASSSKQKFNPTSPLKVEYNEIAIPNEIKVIFSKKEGF